MKEMERLGRPGAYRLGDLRARGAEPVPPRPARPAFARASRRGSLSAWALAFVAGVAAVAAGALAGLFFVPLLVSLLAGLFARWGGWRPRAVLAAGAAAAVIGWGLALGWHALDGEPPGAPAPVVAGVAGAVGLPAHGAHGIEATLLAGIILALAGVGLGLVLAARWASRAQVQVDDARPGGGESGDLVRLLAVSPGPGVASAPTRGAG
jgi:hypothetical protein